MTSENDKVKILILEAFSMLPFETRRKVLDDLADAHVVACLRDSIKEGADNAPNDTR